MTSNILYPGYSCVSFGPKTIRNFEPIVKISHENPNLTSLEKLEDLMT